MTEPAIGRYPDVVTGLALCAVVFIGERHLVRGFRAATQRCNRGAWSAPDIFTGREHLGNLGISLENYV